MTSLHTQVTSLTTQLRTTLADLPAAKRDAVQLTVVLACSDTHEVVRVVINGATVTVHHDDGAAQLRLTTSAALFAEILQTGNVRFVTDPITRGKVGALTQIRGVLRLTLQAGDELRVTFNDAPEPEAVVATTTRDALALLAGTLNPQMAVLTGRMRIVSGMNFLMSLDRIM